MNTIKEESKTAPSSVATASEANAVAKGSNKNSDANKADADDLSLSEQRKKIILGKGYSLMDWIRYTKETPDLAGNKGIPRRISLEELAKHNTVDDCWLAIYDKVYNVTPYMKYHPGGVEELMRGAGKVSTDLFNQVHPWVNIGNMMEKCVVGTLIKDSAPPKDATVSKTATLSSTRSGLTLAPPSLAPPQPLLSVPATVTGHAVAHTPPLDAATTTLTVEPIVVKPALPEIPVLDSYQSESNCIIVLYTKMRSLRKESIAIDKMPNSNSFLLFLYSPDAVYKYELDVPAPVEDHYDIKISREGKIEISLFKVEKIHWWQMCPKLKFKSEIITDINSGVYYRECELVKKTNVNHDTDLYYFNLPPSSRMWIPVGYHVYLRLPDEPLIVKPYTVITDSLVNKSDSCDSGKQICLMIKHYKDGAFTPKLNDLKIGSNVEISNYTGKFDVDCLSKCKELFLICAGTGFTPMIRLISLAIESEQISKITILFFNKTSKDILWRNQLDEIRKKNNRIVLHYVLSEPEPDWTGRRGCISIEMVHELIGRNRTMPYFCVCGPRGFSDLTINLLKNLDYSEDNIFMFSG